MEEERGKRTQSRRGSKKGKEIEKKKIKIFFLASAEVLPRLARGIELLLFAFHLEGEPRSTLSSLSRTTTTKRPSQDRRVENREANSWESFVVDDVVVVVVAA
jgi:hypothetical protein